MGTIAQSIAYWARRKPDKVAVRFMDDTLTYRQFAAICERVRLDLERQIATKPKSDENIALIVISALVYSWPAVVAAQTLGLKTLCVREIDAFAESHARSITCVIVHQAEPGSSRIPDHPDLRDKVVAISEDAYLIDGVRDQPTLSVGESETSGHFLMTSASTGAPKALYIDSAHEREIHGRYRGPRAIRSTSKIHLLNYSPYSSMGYKTFSAALAAGATTVFEAGLHFSRRFHESDVTTALFYPHWLDRLMADEHVAKPRKRPGLVFHLGGGFVSFDKFKWIIDNITENVYNNFSATECMGITMTKVTCPEDLIWHQPLDGADLEVVDGHDKQLPDGTAGVVRIRIRGHGLSRYFRDPDATLKAFRNGYFYPGDMAVRRADGRIRFLGRVADVLALGGNKIPVRPFEEQIEQRTGCQKAAVFARQMDDTHEEVVVAIQADAPLLKNVETWILSLFPPGIKVRIMTHPLFPMTTAGKVDRLTLREIAFASDASSRP